MVIENGYYVSERTSPTVPVSHINLDTLYLPYDIKENDADEGGWKFKEYRVQIPITKDISNDVLKQIVSQVPDTMDAINETLKGIFGENATMQKSNQYASAMQLVKETVKESDDKTVGIAFADLYPVYVQDKYHEVGEVALHPNTGYPRECMTAYDGTVQQDWTIDTATLWKPWHSRKKEYALPWEQPTGAHDMYKSGEYMIWTDGAVYKCTQDTNFSPTEYAQAWEVA